MKLLNKIKNENAIEFQVLIEKSEWEKKHNEAFEKVAKKTASKLKIPGFRPGKVPVEEAKKHVNEIEVFETTTNDLVPQALTFLEQDESFISDNSETVDTPSIDILDFKDGELTLKIAYDLYPVATIDSYNDLVLTPIVNEAFDHEVNAEIEHALSSKSQRRVKDENELIEKGDEVRFDFKGMIDNVPFQGGSAKDHLLTIGSNQFIPGFEDQMIGLKVGEQKNLEVKFPDDYHATDLAGRSAVFEVLIKEITSVKPQELNDEFAKSFNLPNVNTVQELKDYIHNQIVLAKQERNSERAWLEIAQQLLAKAKVTPIPQSLIDREVSTLKQQVISQLSQYKIDLKQYLEFSKKSESQFQEDLVKQAKETIALALLVDDIAENQKIVVSDDEVKERIAEMAKLYQGEEEAIIERLSQNPDAVKEFLLHKKVVNYLIDLNKNNQPKDTASTLSKQEDKPKVAKAKTSNTKKVASKK
ncbi:trigger factor [Ureaplasma urealyticum]|uniref:Trigger factor n=1 Tax=Ureaplasma urealyticum TaxID=2130 RepID=A0ABD4SMH5_UREUR|nr:trigger factor [Ureaplasma urealyticum]MCF1349016.1 trigger factor [Ureaplasma urealyticum]